MIFGGAGTPLFSHTFPMWVWRPVREWIRAVKLSPHYLLRVTVELERQQPFDPADPFGNGDTWEINYTVSDQTTS